MINALNLNQLFCRYPWIRFILWLLVAIWTVYFVRGSILNVIDAVWSMFTMISGWWWAVVKTIFVLCGQLCITVPATGVVYLFAVYIIYPIIDVAFSYFLDQAKMALSPPPPPPLRLFQYTHTHANGQSHTHTHDAEKIEEMREVYQHISEEQLRERRERAERDLRQQNSERGTGKSKRKGKRRKLRVLSLLRSRL
jgi:hypothetical protein